MKFSLPKYLCLIFVMVVLIVPPGIHAKEVVIGFSGPLSGPAAEYGQDCVSGMELAVKEINAAGGISIKGEKYHLRLEKLDDRIDPTQAVNNARRLKEVHQAVAVFSPITAMTYAIMNINQEKGREFLVMAYTSSPSCSKMNNKLTIVIPPTFSIYAQIFSDWAWSRGYRKGGVILTNEVYGDEWTAWFKKNWEKKGGTITSVKPANYYTETDFSPHITAVLATKPDVMLIGGPSATTALVIEQARTLGYKGGFVLIDQAKYDWILNLLKDPKVMGNLAAVASVSSLPASCTPRFNEAYKAQYKRMITWDAVLHYGAVVAVARAIAAANTTSDIWAIRKAFAKAYPLLGDRVPAEVFGLTEDGRQQMACSVQTIENGVEKPPSLYIWWAKTQKEFDYVNKTSKFRGSTPRHWLKAADY
ncbi:MAG TPA: ABC transporter substrate-binding protein [Syntrophales bacterium]|nr:ABC transporter substrate-binding protein [Syntrophales bacterium]HOL58859.1 ABC transporter substrate-binding protein [Syntrophales bacterium]HPO35186.1 ABC transporter substrate-binding protein [Syntrophales bacterium]